MAISYHGLFRQSDRPPVMDGGFHVPQVCYGRAGISLLILSANVIYQYCDICLPHLLIVQIDTQ